VSAKGSEGEVISISISKLYFFHNIWIFLSKQIEKASVSFSALCLLPCRGGDAVREHNPLITFELLVSYFSE